MLKLVILHVIVVTDRTVIHAADAILRLVHGTVGLGEMQTNVTLGKPVSQSNICSSCIGNISGVIFSRAGSQIKNLFSTCRPFTQWCSQSVLSK